MDTTTESTKALEGELVDPVSVFSTDDSVLNYTQNLRKRMADRLLKAGVPPDDREGQEVLLKVLSDMDRAALSKKKIKVEEKQAMNAEQAQQIVAEALRMNSVNLNRNNLIPIEGRVIPTLGDDIPPPTLVDGELAINPAPIDYESFQRSIPRPESDD